MGSKSNEELLNEIMRPEPDYVPGYDERNKIRKKLRTCFDGNPAVVGLPVLNVPTNQTIGYKDLNQRFRDGLATLANMIIASSTSPRQVVVGKLSMEMNSTNAEVVMGTVIDEANKGKIDLTGFDSFWTYVKQQVAIALDESKRIVEFGNNNCESGPAGWSCTPCVCEYKKKVVAAKESILTGIINSGKKEANLMFKVDATKQAQELIDNVVNPWKKEVTCSTVLNKVLDQKVTGICDLSNVPMASTITCQSAFACHSRDLAYSSAIPLISISTEKLYVHEGTLIDLKAPPNAANGASGTTFGANGQNGQNGAKGTGMAINAKSFVDSLPNP